MGWEERGDKSDRRILHGKGSFKDSILNIDKSGEEMEKGTHGGDGN